ncbi:kynurenine 3-monooxygenase isoform X2 [Sitodiplosis mosellana]|uniref:kynurenine 3-monooxygenase isoform X2 n=1 Tax=Sitodiplosis mosellana TaxID=263140 RepID=UPI002443ACB9|nr:kynurenine 3-monooxygenase isoform X2 [Sitodiplosis mosellana]XP_055320532.1 kynurenine 3-monooxygenase isoform X2 [Sitodiplosis mosellana]XP_055320533.1 kynurenine 3-monooxygenase isoform X2 [Sitodiplosis mosellana]XP_055320534.1 kynurenine 3-monooxygenase isoform X2 [Sitodiplosis mosellana]
MSRQFHETFTNGQHDEHFKIIIVGGGLVGSLAALHLAKKGHDIHLYEYREDIRTVEQVQGRSINLALSVRGRKALAQVGLEQKLLEHGIPMRGRMLHDLNGRTQAVPYDSNTNQCIYSVGRKHLNEILLNEAARYPNIHLNFNKKLISTKLRCRQLTFHDETNDGEENVAGDLIIGCDGAFSMVRRHMLQSPGFDFSQTYIDHGYIELCIPPANNEHQMELNYLHIWPRGKFMMIALPNQDKSWTVTLFMPFSNFDAIKTIDELLAFFTENFPDAIDLIGEKRLIDDFFRATPQYLVSIKCRPTYIDPNVLLMGDAAHAMVPFYGQGMNAGFEDCTILSQILDQHHNHFHLALKEFSDTRWQDAQAICDLAMYNYLEMRDLVRSRSYRLRKIFDEFLYRYFPNHWVPLYNSVTFTHMPYKQCIENRKWQDKVLSQIIAFGSVLGMVVLFALAYNFYS